MATHSCTKCGTAFDDPPINGRRRYRCRECQSASLRMWRDRKRALGQLKKYPAGKRAPRVYSAESHRAEYERRKADPAERQRMLARVRARQAIARGRLQRQPCEVCGDPKVQAHHDDYSQPLNVRWLCPTHHREHHAAERAQKEAA